MNYYTKFIDVRFFIGHIHHLILTKKKIFYELKVEKS